jgi:hypothetical protein
VSPASPIPPAGGAGHRSLVICPSRGRPGNVAELLACWADTGATADLRVCVDLDDFHLDDYRALFPSPHGRLLMGQRQSLNGWANHVAVGLRDEYDVVGLIGVGSPST